MGLRVSSWVCGGGGRTCPKHAAEGGESSHRVDRGDVRAAEDEQLADVVPAVPGREVQRRVAERLSQGWGACGSVRAAAVHRLRAIPRGFTYPAGKRTQGPRRGGLHPLTFARAAESRPSLHRSIFPPSGTDAPSRSTSRDRLWLTLPRASATAASALSSARNRAGPCLRSLQAPVATRPTGAQRWSHCRHHKSRTGPSTVCIASGFSASAARTPA